MWDMLGLECIYDINQAMFEVENWDKMRVWNTLKEEKTNEKPNPIPLRMMIMRARFNSQRSYEIYSFTTDFTMDEIKEIFATDPQPIVEWIRENGNKIYSDYVKSERKLIV
jgi:hypothetical protein